MIMSSGLRHIDRDLSREAKMPEDLDSGGQEGLGWRSKILDEPLAIA